MAGSAVAQVQELCDHITSFLKYPRDLKSCALVSTLWASSARRHLFRDVCLYNYYTNDVGDSTCCPWLADRTGRDLDRFCSVIEESRHLLQSMRCIRVDLARPALEKLSNFQFPNLREVHLYGVTTQTFRPSSALIAAGARLIGLPSVHRVGLLSEFTNVDELWGLFTDCTTRLDSLFLYDMSRLAPSQHQNPMRRVTIRHLEVAARPYASTRQSFTGLGWLIHPSSPFDLTALESLDSRAFKGEDSFSELLADSRSTLEQLKIHARSFVQPNLCTLMHLPTVRNLTIAGTTDAAGAVEPLLGRLATLSMMTRLEVLEIELNMSSTMHLDKVSLRKIATVLADATLHAIQRLKIVVHLRPHTPHNLDLVGPLLHAFAAFNTCDKLDVELCCDPRECLADRR